MCADELHDLRSRSTLVLCAECPLANRKGCTRPTPLNAHAELLLASDTDRYLQVEEWASQHVAATCMRVRDLGFVSVCNLKEAVTATALLPLAARAEEVRKPESSMFLIMPPAPPSASYEVSSSKAAVGGERITLKGGLQFPKAWNACVHLLIPMVCFAPTWSGLYSFAPGFLRLASWHRLLAEAEMTCACEVSGVMQAGLRRRHSRAADTNGYRSRLSKLLCFRLRLKFRALVTMPPLGRQILRFSRVTRKALRVGCRSRAFHGKSSSSVDRW